MTLIAVSIPVNDPSDVEPALGQAADAAAAGAELIEWRVDAMVDPDQVPAIASLVGDGPLPCILTARSEDEGGDFEGSPEDLADFLDVLREEEVQPRYIDLEYVAWQESTGLRAAWAAWQDTETGLVLSMHDMLGRPEDLLQVVDAMSSIEEADVVKIAWRARSIRDNLEALELLRSRSRPMIALCMDEAGLPSRVLAGPAGGFLTFVAGASGPTAVGQCSLSQLLEGYRFRSIGAGTHLYGIIGSPVAHSVSPLVHNAAFTATGHDGVFLPLPVAPGWESFKATIASLLEDEGVHLGGLCITQPHKEHALRFVEERGGDVTDIARRAGAANTILVAEDGSLTAENTDAPAIVETLGIEPTGTRVAVLGAGGAARAAVAGLLEAGARVDVFNRTPERALALVDQMNDPMCTIGDCDEVSGYDVVLNATSVGMAGGPDPEGNPLEELGLRAWMLEEASVVYECIYAPRRTPLIEAAEALGTTVVTGEAMFLAQAKRQFLAWTGLEAPIEQWRQLID